MSQSSKVAGIQNRVGGVITPPYGIMERYRAKPNGVTISTQLSNALAGGPAAYIFSGAEKPRR